MAVKSETRNCVCTRSLLANPVIFALLDLATFLTVIQIAYLSFKAHKLAREHQCRQSLSGEKIKELYSVVKPYAH